MTAQILYQRIGWINGTIQAGWVEFAVEAAGLILINGKPIPGEQGSNKMGIPEKTARIASKIPGTITTFGPALSILLKAFTMP